MTYCHPNFKTKKQLKEALVNGVPVTVFEPGLFDRKYSGEHTACLEGPHYPQPHKWYARVKVVDSYVVKVLS